MRAIWSGSISFGLVNIPIRLYSALETESLKFDFLHKEDLSPIRYAKICKKEEKEVSYDQIIKGYPYQGSYIPMDDDDFKNANIKEANSINIQAFVDEKEVEDIYIERPYYLEPAKESLKAYSLFKNALQVSNKAAIGKFILRNREHLAMIRPYKNILLLLELRFESELRTPNNFQIQEIQLEDKEINLALALIDQLTKKFKPAEYKDTYEENLTKVIEAKSRGHKIKAPEEITTPTGVTDLMATLKASLEQEKTRTK